MEISVEIILIKAYLGTMIGNQARGQSRLRRKDSLLKALKQKDLRAVLTFT